jgi:hypothetical protein
MQKERKIKRRERWRDKETEKCGGKYRGKEIFRDGDG